MTVLSLTNSNGDLVEINPESGAALTKLVLNNEDVVKYPLKAGDLKKGYPSAFLFPFPNRIKDGRYNFQGIEYTLDINDTDRSNAIHGIIAFKPFDIVKEEKSTVSLSYRYFGENPGYPFPFLFTISYLLKKGELELIAEIENTGEEALPFGFGWHPYFCFSKKAIGKMELEIPDRVKMELSDRYIPTGNKTEENKTRIPLKNTILDNVFAIKKESKTTEFTLRCNDKALIVSQESKKDKLQYFVLYTPASRDCIAIEPQSCNTNAFNNGEGLQVLESGSKTKFKISVRVEA
jgi:aldose 1-epimerase